VASLTLSPPDLGPIQVVLKVDNQSVNPSFISDNPLVRQALEDGMQDLRDRMQSQGLQLGQTFVGNEQQAQQHFEQQSGRENARASASASDTDTAITPQTAVQPRVVRGLVDTFV
jgi:flagellar hook-length control protein FliK